MWAQRALVRKYAHQQLRPAEVELLDGHRQALSGRVLELGCGAGRLTGHLAEIADSVHAIDVSPHMVAHCHRAYPQVTVEQRDLRDLSVFGAGSFDVVVAEFNVLDVLNDRERRTVLDEVRRILRSEGLLMMSSHNRDATALITLPTTLRRGLITGALDLARLPRRLLNRRRLIAHERAEPGYAILNDVSHNFAGLHYYVSREAQERQFAEHGFAVVETRDRDGRVLPAGDRATGSSELHYVARAWGAGVNSEG